MNLQTNNQAKTEPGHKTCLGGPHYITIWYNLAIKTGFIEAVICTTQYCSSDILNMKKSILTVQEGPTYPLT